MVYEVMEDEDETMEMVQLGADLTENVLVLIRDTSGGLQLLLKLLEIFSNCNLYLVCIILFKLLILFTFIFFYVFYFK